VPAACCSLLPARRSLLPAAAVHSLHTAAADVRSLHTAAAAIPPHAVAYCH
jgi:hypothetical protein